MSTLYVPANAVGFFVIIRPTLFYIWGAIEDDYKKLSARIMQDRHRTGTPDDLVKAGVHLVLDGATANTTPEIRALPLEHPHRQEVLRKIKLGASILAGLRRELFFAIIIGEDIVEDADDFAIETVPAKSIAEAHRLIMARPDVQAIEQHRAVTWNPTRVS